MYIFKTLRGSAVSYGTGVILGQGGKQGTGKDLLLDIVAELMGSKKRFESVQPEVDVYGEFNPLLMGGLVIQLSEIDKRNTMKL